MPEATVNIEVYCAECGGGLCDQTKFVFTRLRHEPSFRVEPCKYCLQKAYDDGYEAGYERARQKFDVE